MDTIQITCTLKDVPSFLGVYLSTILTPMPVPNDQNILSFIRRNAAIWGYNSIPLEGPTSVVCGQYCCLFARYMDKRITPLMFVRLFPADGADKQAA